MRRFLNSSKPIRFCNVIIPYGSKQSITYTVRQNHVRYLYLKTKDQWLNKLPAFYHMSSLLQSADAKQEMIKLLDDFKLTLGHHLVTPNLADYEEKTPEILQNCYETITLLNTKVIPELTGIDKSVVSATSYELKRLLVLIPQTHITQWHDGALLDEDYYQGPKLRVEQQYLQHPSIINHRAYTNHYVTNTAFQQAMSDIRDIAHIDNKNTSCSLSTIFLNQLSPSEQWINPFIIQLQYHLTLAGIEVGLNKHQDMPSTSILQFGFDSLAQNYQQSLNQHQEPLAKPLFGPKNQFHSLKMY